LFLYYIELKCEREFAKEVTKMKLRIAFFTVTLSLILCTSLMSADWGILMIDLGKKDVSNGVLLLAGGDGFTEPDSIGGKDCRSVPKVPPGQNTGNHAYFIVDGTVVNDKSAESKLWIGVEYYDLADDGPTDILMDYDDIGDAYPNQAFALTLPKDNRVIKFTKTEKWMIAIIAIDKAEFKEQGNGGDFRFHIEPYMSDIFYLDRVWVSNKELKEDDLTGVKAVSPGGKLAVSWGELKREN
jgi:hypothetical protein